jgi:hypothetical protein
MILPKASELHAGETKTTPELTRLVQPGSLLDQVKAQAP